MNDVAFLDATTQAELVREKQVKPEELLDGAIERIERLNPKLNEVELIATILDELGIDYPVMTAVGELGTALAGGEVLPFTWLIDRQGRLRASHGGLASEGSLRRICRKLLEESGDGR